MPSRPLVGKEEIALPSGPDEQGYSYLRGTDEATGNSEHHQPTKSHWVDFRDAISGDWQLMLFLGLQKPAELRRKKSKKIGLAKIYRTETKTTVRCPHHDA